jgi:DNA-binding FadR family transcriptional regulator
LLREVGQRFDERRNPLFEQWGSHFETPRSRATAVDEERQVLHAITAQAPQAAGTAMDRHLSNSHECFTAQWPAHAPATDAAPDIGA